MRPSLEKVQLWQFSIKQFRSCSFLIEKLNPTLPLSRGGHVQALKRNFCFPG